MRASIPMRTPHATRESDNQRIMAAARASLEALLAQAAGRDGGFYGRIAVEVSVQNGVLGHVKETIERTRK